MRTYYVYIMASRSRVLYTGVTNDLARRVYEHKRSLTPGFTSRYRITRLVYFEEFGAAQRLGSHTQGAVDRTEQPHMGGLGGRLVRGTFPSIMTLFYRSRAALSS